MIEISGKKYNAVTEPGFEYYDGYEAKIVSGVNTPSGQAVAVKINGEWQFVNPSVK